MKTVNLFNLTLECSYDVHKFVEHNCSLYHGVMNTDFTTIKSFYPSLIVSEVVDLVKRIYGTLSDPIVEISIIRDSKGVPIKFNPETRMPYVEEEQKE